MPQPIEDARQAKAEPIEDARQAKAQLIEAPAEPSQAASLTPSIGPGRHRLTRGDCVHRRRPGPLRANGPRLCAANCPAVPAIHGRPRLGRLPSPPNQPGPHPCGPGFSRWSPLWAQSFERPAARPPRL